MKETATQNDGLLNQLVQTAKDVEAEDAAVFKEPWDQLTAGTLERDEVAAFTQTSEEARQNYETYRPLGEEFHDRVVDALQTQTGGGASRREDPVSPTSATVLPFRRRLQRFGGLVAAAAIAATLLLMVGRPSVDPAPLPEYRVELVGGARVERSANQPSDEPQRFVQGNRLQVHLRPLAVTEGDVAARCFLARGDELRHWEAPMEISPQGAIRISAHIGQELDLEPGSWTLWLTIGRPEALPDVDTLRTYLNAPAPASWALYGETLVIDSPTAVDTSKKPS